jgi:hypothetical protein
VVKLVAPWLVALGAVAGACAKPPGERPSAVPVAPGRAAEAAPGAPAPSVTAGPEAAAPVPNGSLSPPASPDAPAVPLAPERHGPPLPELTVKSFGLHIGGSAADAAARAEFLRALEASTGHYLDCYRAIEEPGRVGTFGADLTVGGAGGKPRVGKPRTKLPGEGFQTCMVRVLSGVSFPSTPSGRAVVVSYSVKFSFADGR